MLQFIRDNAAWLTPVLVAIVSGVFLLLSKIGTKKGSNTKIRQKAKNNDNANIYQAGRDININQVDYEKIKRLFIEVNKENETKNSKNAEAELKPALNNLDRILDLLNSGKSFTANELEKEMKLSRSTIQRYIDKLLKEGIIIQTGTMRFARYKKAASRG